LRSVAKRVGHAEEKGKKEAKALRPCGVLKQKAESIRPFWEVQSVWRNREKYGEKVKKKKETFFFVQVTHKEDKLVEFSWSFLNATIMESWSIQRKILLLALWW